MHYDNSYFDGERIVKANDGYFTPEEEAANTAYIQLMKEHPAEYCKARIAANEITYEEALNFFMLKGTGRTQEACQAATNAINNVPAKAEKEAAKIIKAYHTAQDNASARCIEYYKKNPEAINDKIREALQTFPLPERLDGQPYGENAVDYFPTIMCAFIVQYLAILADMGSKDFTYIDIMDELMFNKYGLHISKKTADALRYFLASDELWERIEKDKTFSTAKLATIAAIKKSSVYSESNSKVANRFSEVQRILSTDSNGQLTFFFDEKPEDDQVIPVGISAPKSKKQVISYVSLSYEGEPVTYNRQRIQRYDENVLNTICTLKQCGNNHMTIPDIFRTMQGNKAQYPTQKQADRIRESIRKLASTRVYIDVTQEVNAKYKLPDDRLKTDDRLKKVVIDEALLVYTGIEAATVNGLSTYALTLDKMPILFEYSQAKGEIVSYPIELLDVPVNENETITAIKFYLLKQIHLITKGQRNNPCINYESMYSSVGVPVPGKQQRDRDRKYIHAMLETWKKQNVFTAFEEYKEGRTIAGVKILF